MKCKSPFAALEAARAFAHGDYLYAAELFSEMGSRTNEAYAQLSSGEATQVLRARGFYRSVGATYFVKCAEELLPASA